MKINSKLAAGLLIGSLLLVGCTAQPGNNNNSSSTSSSDSNTNLGGGSAVKPASWPSSIPTLDGAYNYNYAKASDTYYLGYEIQTSQSVEETANKVDAQLKSTGWSLQSDASADTAQGSIRAYDQGSNHLTLAVSAADSGNVHTIAIIMGPQTSNEGN
jgi:hypothetical protein